mgnify:CR=1 FL=1
MRSLARLEGLPIILVFALLLGLFMGTAPQVFLAPNIYTTFLSTLPPLILLATGLTFVIAAGEIDLSYPSVIAFSGFVFAVLFKEYELGWIAELMAHRDEPGPRIVAGDFNASPWSPFMRDFIRVTGLRDASGGGLREPTRQPMLLSPYLSWLGAPVDHLLVSPDVAVRSFSIGRHVESDHLPIIADLQLAGAGERDQSSGIKPAR